jgi:epoxide hydrolase-like predicted phosphatase
VTDDPQRAPRATCGSSPAVIFDFGAVLFRWRPAALLARVLPELAIDAARTQALVEGFFQGYGGDWGRFDRGTISVDELAASISRRLHASLGVSQAHAHALIAAVPDELSPIADSVALLQRLHAGGHRLFYLSNMPAPYAEHLERSHAFMACFEDGVFSSRVGLCKPELAIFELALQRFGLAPADAVFLDDHAANVHAARALGLPTIHFSDAAQAGAELCALGVSAAARATLA